MRPSILLIPLLMMSVMPTASYGGQVSSDGIIGTWEVVADNNKESTVEGLVIEVSATGQTDSAGNPTYRGVVTENRFHDCLSVGTAVWPEIRVRGNRPNEFLIDDGLGADCQPGTDPRLGTPVGNAAFERMQYDGIDGSWILDPGTGNLDDPDDIIGRYESQGSGPSSVIEITGSAPFYEATVVSATEDSCYAVGQVAWPLIEFGKGVEGANTQYRAENATFGEDCVTGQTAGVALIRNAGDRLPRAVRLDRGSAATPRSVSYDRIGDAEGAPDPGPTGPPGEEPETTCLAAGTRQVCPIGGDEAPQPARQVELSFAQQMLGTFTAFGVGDKNQTRVIDVDGVLLGTLVGNADDDPCPQVGDPYWVIEDIDESGGTGFFTSCSRGEVPATFTPTFGDDGQVNGLEIRPEGIGVIQFTRDRAIVHASGTTGQDVALGVALLWADTYWNEPDLRQGVERVLFVATDANFADNLSMAGVTGQARGLALQISPTDREANLAAISRLRPDRLVVVGGQAAIPDAVLPTDVPIDRVAGANRFDTAAQMARSFYPEGSTTVMVATGGNFPDAVAAGARASIARVPMLLVDGDRMPSETLGELQRLSPERIIVLGGSAVVPASIEDQLQTLAGTVERYQGPTRMETAAEVSRQTHPDGAKVVYVANGNEFNNALTAASNAWLYGGPLLLTGPTSLPEVTATELARLDPDHVFVVSDRFEFDAGVHAEIASALGGSPQS